MNNKARRIGLFLSVAVTLVFAATSSASIITSAQSLQDVVNGGGSFRVGDKVFSDFSLVSSHSPNMADIGLSNVAIQGFYDPSSQEYGLNFVAPLVAGPNQILDVILTFKVTADEPNQVKDVGLTLDNYSIFTSGMISVSENVYLQNPGVVHVNNPAIATLGAVYFQSLGQVLVNQTSGLAEFRPTSSIWVSKDFTVSGDGVGVALLSGFSQSFSQAPEPVTMGLLAVGGLVTLVRRRR